jgi:hypothetical protein
MWDPMQDFAFLKLPTICVQYIVALRVLVSNCLCLVMLNAIFLGR